MITLPIWQACAIIAAVFGVGYMAGFATLAALAMAGMADADMERTTGDGAIEGDV